MITVVDSDGLIGSISSADIHHQRALVTLEALANRESLLIYPVTTLAESITLLQGRLKSPELAAEIIDLINTSAIYIEPVDAHIVRQAAILIDLKRTKHNTLFDAIVAAIALKYKADAIFSFDGFYKKQGFKLASELIKE